MVAHHLVADAEALDELRANPRNMRFDRLCNIAIGFGFRFRGGRGSHRVFVRDGVTEILNVQDVGGRAKPYQVRQLIKIIEKYGLHEEKSEEGG